MPVTNFPNGISAAPVGISGPLTGAIGAVTAVSATVSLAALSGKVTTISLTTGPNLGYGLVINNSMIAAGDIVVASVALGTNTTGAIAIGHVHVTAGSVNINIRNVDAAASLNGTAIVSFQVFKAT
jgi:hypothetical protein